MSDVTAAGRPAWVRKATLVATFAVPALLLIFGGDFRQAAWLAALAGMAALCRSDLDDAGSGDSGLVVTEKWRGRLALYAGWLALLLTYQGVQGAEEARVLRRELATVCGNNQALCGRLDAAQAVASDAGAAALADGQKPWGYAD